MLIVRTTERGEHAELKTFMILCILYLECALAHKEDGNHHFKLNEYKRAVAAYTEGLKQVPIEADLRVILYTNRAAAQFYLRKLFMCFNFIDTINSFAVRSL